MEHYNLDPYEQQLLKVFNNHDRDRKGTLDRDGLNRLCQTLQLEEQGSELIKCLLTDKNSRRVTFPEFKDALLTLLGNMQKKSDETQINTEKSSPDREVSPKFVYGSKKYGRRSRPRMDDLEKGAVTPVQRSNSQSEVISKKRKTNYKLKRCTSLPGDNIIANPNLTEEASDDIVCTEDMLREAWRNLGVGEDGYLNQSELVLVCNAIGLHKLANGVLRQLSDKLTYDYKISFNELLEALKEDETWFEVFNEPTNESDSRLAVVSSSESLFPDSRTFQYVTMGPDGNGQIAVESLIEMWESVGIHAPKELLHEMGFNSCQISVIELAELLEKQLKQMNDSERGDFQSPHVALLQANLTLYQSEIRCLRSILEQMNAEREKLKCDVVEANNRATLLAQEVDDNHSRMEQNTINQVKLLEQRHTDLLKDLTTQYAKDKEHLTSINHDLELKINLLENETVKLKNDLIVSQKYVLDVEKDNHNLSVQISELENDKTVLSQHITVLEQDKQKSTEIERKECEALLRKMNELQIQNSKLKDHNDEMVTEIENLNCQMSSMKSKAQSTPTRVCNTLDQSMGEENISIISEAVGLGAKRRSDYSPTKDTRLFGTADSSPRLGKVRKCQKSAKTGDTLDVPFTTSSESGFDTEPESLSNSACDAQEELVRLHAKIAFLEQVLKQNNIPLPENHELEMKSKRFAQLNNRVRQLEKTIENVQRLVKKSSPEIDSVTLQTIDTLLWSRTVDSNSIDNHAQTELTFDCIDENMATLEKENVQLLSRCSELETSVDLLRNEYEKCEDYWQNKMDQERQFFEAEQKVNTEHLNELLLSLHEYEEQYGKADDLDGRLPPIEETANLEKQFTDLEQEFEQYKLYHEIEIDKRDEEISLLKEKLTELALKQRDMIERAVQVDEDAEERRILGKMKNFTSYVIENTNRCSEDMMPPQQAPPPSVTNNKQWPSEQVASLKPETLLPLTFSFVPQSNEVPSTSSSQNSTPCRPKRTRKHDKNIYKKSNNSVCVDAKKTETNGLTVPSMGSSTPTDSWSTCTKQFPNAKDEQTISIPLTTYHNLNGKKNFLEQKVRQMQLCLNQQRCRNEQILHCYWQQFRGERADLHSKLKFFQEKLDQQVRVCKEQLEKLHRTDMLVKDLYVENSYLFATVERLETQCRMLSQCNNTTNNSM